MKEVLGLIGKIFNREGPKVVKLGDNIYFGRLPKSRLEELARFKKLEYQQIEWGKKNPKPKD